MVNLPFQEEKIQENIFIRTFDPQVESEELKWHIDLEDRLVECSQDSNWFLQIDNQLPTIIPEKILIKSGVWHRLIRGDQKLTLKITKIIPGLDI